VVDRQRANHGVAGTRTVTPIGDRADWRDETSGDVEANVLATACMRCNAPSFLWPSEYSYRLCADSFVQLPLRTTQSTSVRVGWVRCHSRDQGWQTLESVEKLRHVYQSDVTLQYPFGEAPSGDDKRDLFVIRIV